MTTSPDPPEQIRHELDALFFQGLWDNKRNRNQQSVICKHYEGGGLIKHA